jgi:hypothetical protein
MVDNDTVCFVAEGELPQTCHLNNSVGVSVGVVHVRSALKFRMCLELRFLQLEV